MTQQLNWYDFRQNNSGGSFIVNDTVTILVNIQAPSERVANALAEDYGIEFNVGCECCGDRWEMTSDWEAESEPRIADEYEIQWVDDGEPYCINYYFDGTKKVFVKGVDDVVIAPEEQEKDTYGIDTNKVLKMIVGKTVLNVFGLSKHSEEVNINFTDGSYIKFYHEQDCCESVSLEDFETDLSRLKGSTIVEAFESSKNNDSSEYHSATWTFYNINFNNTYLNMRFLGTSNGWYSESVDVCYVNENGIKYTSGY